MMKVTTKSGRTYLIDKDAGLWQRLGKNGGRDDSWESIWKLQRGTDFNFPWNSPEGTWEDGDPEVGKFMFISCKDYWWTSTEVVSVEEV